MLRDLCSPMIRLTIVISLTLNNMHAPIKAFCQDLLEIMIELKIANNLGLQFLLV